MNGASTDRPQVVRMSEEHQLSYDVRFPGWREFRFVLDTSRAGRLDVAVRARSRNGAKQPDKLTPNPSGYHDNIVQAVSLEIA